jgi:hypothetical protein
MMYRNDAHIHFVKNDSSNEEESSSAFEKATSNQSGIAQQKLDDEKTDAKAARSTAPSGAATRSQPSYSKTLLPKKPLS